MTRGKGVIFGRGVLSGGSEIKVPAGIPIRGERDAVLRKLHKCIAYGCPVGTASRVNSEEQCRDALESSVLNRNKFLTFSVCDNWGSHSQNGGRRIACW